MKKIAIISLLAALALGRLGAQEACYWVLLTDKEGSTFDPYPYFDPKAVERYEQCGADLWDVSNYPVSQAYESQVEALVSENLGPSRWLNAVAVMASPEQVAALEELPFVREVKLVGGEWQMCQVESSQLKVESSEQEANSQFSILNAQLTDQLIRMGGALFQEKGIDGRGIRVAVFDGGFPHVNTHQAFKHLRDEGRILKTWNFPDKKEDVYLAGSHGTMTLSCIAGCLGDRQIGLATGAEFLLARTEIGPEPIKEEVWWMQAMEWADKNGAQIISSSLGYGKERHYTYEMDGRSYVARAANMAARKGLLVCNSAGNEGDDRRWKTIITPADADSVLCVAGIVDRLDVYRHINFSSYGPGADGRRKPNVCAFGHAYVAKHSDDTALTQAYGTSFSCPLVAGFAACAWQTRPNATAMEMMQAIEQSADLYPYYDYALGYGVPQARFFVPSRDGASPVSTPTFRFEDKDFYVAVIPTGKYDAQRPAVKFEESENSQRSALNSQLPKPTFFFKVQDRKGQLEKFYSLEFNEMGPSQAIAFRKSALYRRTLVVHYNGYTDSLTLSDQENRRLRDRGEMGDFEYVVIDTAGYLQFAYDETMSRTPEDNRVKEKPLSWDVAALYGLSLSPTVNPSFTPISDCFTFSIRAVKPQAKKYALGVGLDLGWNTYRLAIEDDWVHADRIRQFELGAEIFQRVTLVPGGALFHRGLHWDFGLFAHYVAGSRRITDKSEYPDGGCINVGVTRIQHSYFYHNDLHLDRLHYGLATRLSWDWVGLYATYRLSSLLLDGGDFALPALNVGVQINL